MLEFRSIVFGAIRDEFKDLADASSFINSKYSPNEKTARSYLAGYQMSTGSEFVAISVRYPSLMLTFVQQLSIGYVDR